MRVSLVAAMLGATGLAIVTHDGPAPTPTRDPHDTIVAVPDSADQGGVGACPECNVGTPARRVSFAVKFKDEVSPFPIMAMFVMPGEQVPIEAVLSDTTARYTAQATAGRLARFAPGRWRWTAPTRKGLYPIFVRDSASGETVTLNAFVLVPFPNARTIGQFMIGSYQSRPLRGDPAYARPTGFIEVTEANKGTLVAPHFTLDQFTSKQSATYPKYLVLRERLLLKLEMLLEEARSAGYAASTFRILSGYRTPFYNRRIGNETRYSRHVYGDAADIFVDDDQDGTMDDLNGDGKSNVADAAALGDLIERLSDKSWYQPFEGGLGLYKGNRGHGPFLHVDVRGHPARWGP